MIAADNHDCTVSSRLYIGGVDYLKWRLKAYTSDRITAVFCYRRSWPVIWPDRPATHIPLSNVTSLLVNTHFEFCFLTAVNHGNDHASLQWSLYIVYPLDISIMKEHRLIWKWAVICMVSRRDYFLAGVNSYDRNVKRVSWKIKLVEETC